jgi:hypothetical protein
VGLVAIVFEPGRGSIDWYGRGVPVLQVLHEGVEGALETGRRRDGQGAQVRLRAYVRLYGCNEGAVGSDHTRGGRESPWD